jgi:hypothetical protein
VNGGGAGDSAVDATVCQEESAAGGAGTLVAVSAKQGTAVSVIHSSIRTVCEPLSVIK